MKDLNFKTCIIIQAIIGLILYGLFLSLNKITPTLFVYDYWFSLDQVYRIEKGLIPYRDIYSSIGFLFYGSIYLLLKLGMHPSFIPGFIGLLWWPVLMLCSYFVWRVSSKLWVLFFYIALMSWGVGPVHDIAIFQAVWMAPYASLCWPISFALLFAIMKKDTNPIYLGLFILVLFGLKINYAIFASSVIFVACFYHKSFKFLYSALVPLIFLLIWFTFSPETLLSHIDVIRLAGSATQEFDPFRFNMKYYQIESYIFYFPFLIIVLIPFFYLNSKRDFYFLFALFLLSLLNSFNDFIIFSPFLWAIGIIALIHSRASHLHFFYAFFGSFIIFLNIATLAFQHNYKDIKPSFETVPYLGTTLNDVGFLRFLESHQSIRVPPDLKVVFGTFAQIQFITRSEMPKTSAWFDWGRTFSTSTIRMKDFEDADVFLANLDKGWTSVMMRSFIHQRWTMCRELRSWVIYSKNCKNPLISKIYQTPALDPSIFEETEKEKEAARVAAEKERLKNIKKEKLTPPVKIENRAGFPFE